MYMHHSVRISRLDLPSIACGIFGVRFPLRNLGWPLRVVILKLEFVFLFFPRLFPFPTAKKKPEERKKWKQLVNRQDNKGKFMASRCHNN